MMVELKLTPAQMQLLNEALIQLPFWKAAPLIDSINAQLSKAKTPDKEEAKQ